MAEDKPTTALATTGPRKSITATVADRYGMEADAFEATLRATVFKEGTKGEFAAFLVVANEHNLNPLTKEIFGFKGKSGGIQAVVSVDGWARIINEHPMMDGFEFVDILDADGGLVAITCRMYRKDRSRPGEATEYMAECVQSKDTWTKWPRRMLRHKALIQAARYTFGFGGIVDEDEYERIVSVQTLDGARPGLDPGFGPTEALGSPRTAEEPEPDNRTAEAEKAPEAAPGEPQDAVFEEVQPAQEIAHDPETGEVLDEETVEEGVPAPGDTYFMAGETFDPKTHRRTTYKDGVPFSSATRKTLDEGKTLVFGEHAPERAESEPEKAPPPADDFPGDRPKGAETLPKSFVAAMEALSVAPHYLAAKQELRRLGGTDEWKNATETARATAGRALWNRFAELREAGAETTAIIDDWTLMGLWLDYGASSETDISAMWRQFWKSELYKKAAKGEQLAMTERMQVAVERVAS